MREQSVGVPVVNCNVWVGANQWQSALKPVARMHISSEILNNRGPKP